MRSGPVCAEPIEGRHAERGSVVSITRTADVSVRELETRLVGCIRGASVEFERRGGALERWPIDASRDLDVGAGRGWSNRANGGIYPFGLVGGYEPNVYFGFGFR